MLRSIAAVIAGYVVFAVSAVALFVIAGRDAQAAAPVGFMIFSTVYGMLFAGLAGYLAARIAGRRELLHAAIVTTIIAAGAVSAIFTRPEGGTIWAQLAAVLLMAPAATLGGWLRRPRSVPG